MQWYNLGVKAMAELREICAMSMDGRSKEDEIARLIDPESMENPQIEAGLIGIPVALDAGLARLAGDLPLYKRMKLEELIGVEAERLRSGETPAHADLLKSSGRHG